MSKLRLRSVPLRTAGSLDGDVMVPLPVLPPPEPVVVPPVVVPLLSCAKAGAARSAKPSAVVISNDFMSIPL